VGYFDCNVGRSIAARVRIAGQKCGEAYQIAAVLICPWGHEFKDGGVLWGQVNRRKVVGQNAGAKPE
jgi:hypothetical protein